MIFNLAGFIGTMIVVLAAGIGLLVALWVCLLLAIAIPMFLWAVVKVVFSREK